MERQAGFSKSSVGSPFHIHYRPPHQIPARRSTTASPLAPSLIRRSASAFQYMYACRILFRLRLSLFNQRSCRSKRRFLYNV